MSCVQVFHFFASTEADQGEYGDPKRYWLQIFPQLLDQVACDYFKSGPERLSAIYTEELMSWFLKAKGFGMSLDTDTLATKFLNKFDQALEATKLK